MRFFAQMEGMFTRFHLLQLCAETKNSCSAMAKDLRAEVGEDCITQKDYAFKSLSGAAQFVGGCALNGHICWTEVRQEPKRKKKG